MDSTNERINHLEDEVRRLKAELEKAQGSRISDLTAEKHNLEKIREELLRKNREMEENNIRLTMLLDAANSGLWNVKVDNTNKDNPIYTYSRSKELRKILGFSEDPDADPLPQESSWSDRLHPDDKERVLDEYHKFMLDKTGKIQFDVVYKLLKKNGEYAYIHDFGIGIRDENGNLLNIIGAIRDVTVLKLAEQELFNEQQRLKAERERLEAFPDIVLYRNVLNTKTNEIKYSFMSSGWEDMIGVPAKDAMNDFAAILKVIHPDDREYVKQTREKSANTMSDFFVEYRLIFQGDIRWIRMSSRPHQENEFIVWDGYAINIDKRKEVEQELEVERNRLQLLANNLPDSRLCQFTMDTKTNDIQMSYISSDNDDTTVIPYESALNNYPKFLSLINPNDRPILSENIQNTAKTLNDLNMELRFVGNWMQLSMRPRKDGDKIIWDGIIMNIDDRKKNEAELANYREKLETIVKERTDDLQSVNDKLNVSLNDTAIANRELSEVNIQLEKTIEIRTLFFKVLQSVQFSNDISADMKDILAEIGKYSGMSRINIFEKENNKIKKIFEWLKDGIAPEIKSAMHHSFLDLVEDFGNTFENLIDTEYMSNKDSYIYFTEDSANKNMETMLKMSGSRSILIIPLIVSDLHYGFIEFNECVTGRTLQEQEIEMLVNISRILSNATHRRRIETSMHLSQQTMTAVLDNLDFVVYTTDIEKYTILFANKKAKEVFGDIEGKLCWQSVQTGKTGPCDFCPNKDLLDKNNCPTGFASWEFHNEETNEWLLRRVAAIKWIDDRWVQLNYATDITSLKNNEIELEQVKQEILVERNRLMTIADNIPDNCLMRLQIKTALLSQPNAMFEWIYNIKLVYVSSNWQPITNISIEDAMQNPALMFQNFHPDDMKIMAPVIFNHICNNTVLDKEFRFLFCDGNVKWLRIKFSSHIEDEWTIMDGILFDKTKNKLEEIELTNYRENLELLVKERTTNLDTANKKLESTNDELFAANEELYATNEELHSRNEQLAAEIAARIEAVARQAESEEKLSRFIKQTVEGISFSDSEGKIIEWNPEQERITGVSRNQAIGKYGWEIFEIMMPGEEIRKEKLRKILLSLLNPRNQYELEKDKYEVAVSLDLEKTKHLVFYLFRLTIGDNKYSIGQILKDVTEQKFAEEELEKYHTQLEQMVELKTIELTRAKEKAEESDKLKSAFLANMSHEIRTPLNGIVGFLNFIFYDDVTPEERQEYINIVNNNSIQLTKIIEDIIDISKIEANSMTICPISLKLNDLMYELRAFFKTYTKTNHKENIELILDDSEFIDNCTIFVDSTRLRQTLTNLIVNAFKFTETGFVRFGYRQSAPNVLEFVIEDSGIGLSQDQQKIIFERFRQVELGNTRQYGGTGLGLTISLNLVQLMGGDMWIKSERGSGASFFFSIPYLPIANEDMPIFEIRTDKELQQNKPFIDKTIMVVEPSITKFKYYERIIMATGANVLDAEDLQSIIEIIGKNITFDYLFLEKEHFEEKFFSNYNAIKKVPIVIVDTSNEENFVPSDEQKLNVSTIQAPVYHNDVLRMLETVV